MQSKSSRAYQSGRAKPSCAVMRFVGAMQSGAREDAAEVKAHFAKSKRPQNLAVFCVCCPSWQTWLCGLRLCRLLPTCSVIGVFFVAFEHHPSAVRVLLIRVFFFVRPCSGGKSFCGFSAVACTEPSGFHVFRSDVECSRINKCRSLRCFAAVSFR